MQRVLRKKYRGKEIVGMKPADYYDAIQKSTWFHLQSNSLSQIIYCLRRMADPVLEHVDNNFKPLPQRYIDVLLPFRDEVVEVFEKCHGNASAQ